MRISISLVAIAVVLALGGCKRASSNLDWQNPDVPQSEWASDVRSCKRYARREAEKEAGLPASSPTTNTLGSNTSYNQAMLRHDLKRFEDRTFVTCMTASGYAVRKKK